MPTTLRAFAKINLGLYIGPRRADGFHELRTVYQTVDAHDTVRVSVGPGTGIEIRCKHPQVPQDESNTCWRSRRAGHAGAQAAAAGGHPDRKKSARPGRAWEQARLTPSPPCWRWSASLASRFRPDDKLAIASEIGSDLPLFLVGGTVLGIGHGEQVLPLPDLPPLPLAIAFPNVGVSTPQAFADWDSLLAAESALVDARQCAR